MKYNMKVLAVLAIIPFAIVGGTATSYAEHKNSVEIHLVWGALAPAEEKMWVDTIIKPFEAKYPKIHIKLESLAGGDIALKVRLASGNVPDMFMTDAFTIKTYQEAGLLLNLDKYIEQYRLNRIIFPWAMETVDVAGSKYAIPLEYDAALIQYNTGLLKELNLPVPRTRAQFVAACEAAIKAGIICVAYGNSTRKLPNQWLYDKYITNYAGVNAVVDLFKGRTKFTDPEIKGAFELLNSDWQKGWFNNKNTAAISDKEARSLWYTGKALFSAEGSWRSGEIASVKPQIEWGADSWPSMLDGVPSAASIGVGSTIAVSKTAKYPSEIAKFLSYMYKRPSFLMGQGIAGGMPQLAMVLKPSILPGNIDANVKKMLDALIKVTKKQKIVGFVPWSYYPPQTNVFLYNNLDKIFYGTMTTDSYLSQAQEILDKELAGGFKFAGK